MYKTINSICSAVPTPLCGLALGIASLGFGLENALPLHAAGQTVAALVSVALLSAVLVKFLLNPGLFHREMGNPVLGSIMPTFAMTLMLISSVAGTWNAKLGAGLWLFAVGLHLLLMAVFLCYRLRSLRLAHLVPSWFVPFVGIILAAVTVPGPQYHALAEFLMLFGMISYALMLPLMVYRLIFSGEVADAAKPTIAVLAAPASLSLVGYLNLSPSPSLLLCGALLGLALLMTAVVYLALFRLLRLPFSPAFASCTFPLAVGATALYKAAGFLESVPEAAALAGILGRAAVYEMLVATLVVAYVCLRYLYHYSCRIPFLNRQKLCLLPARAPT